MPYPYAYPFQSNPFGFQPPQQQVVRVNGRGGAETYALAPNSSALLLDETAPVVWLVQTDGAGYKTLNPYNIEPVKPAPSVDVSSLESRVAKLEELIHDKPDSRSAEHK